MERIDECCSHTPEEITERQEFWNKDFQPVSCETIEEFNVKLGHEIAMEIKTTREEGKKLMLILPVGPMGMYQWVVYFLKNGMYPVPMLHALIWMSGQIKMEIP